MEVVLDTNTYSDWIRRGSWTDPIAAADRVWLTPIVVGELFHGFQNGFRFRKNVTILRDFLAQPSTGVFDVTFETGQLFGELLAFLRRNGTQIPTNDIWIAASCYQHGATLLTADRHFEALPQILVRGHDPNS